MPRAPLRSISVVLLVSCGEGGAKDSAGSASDGSSGAPPTTSTSDAPTSAGSATGGAMSTTGGVSTSTTADETSTGSDTSGTTSSSSGTTATGTTSSASGATTTGTTGDETTGGTTGGGAGDYAAFWWSGGLNHLIVRKLEDGRCTTLSLARPSQSPPEFSIVMPSEWAVQAASINADQGECLSNWQPPPETVPAKGGSGLVAFEGDPMLFCPKTVDVDVVLNFDEGMPDVPVEDALVAVAVPVQGCG